MLRVFVIALAIIVTSVASAEAAPPREAAAATLEAAGKLYCHRTMRATSWIATGEQSGSGGQLYREADQDNTDTTLCGIRTSSGNWAAVWSSLPANTTPTVSTGLGGITTTQTSGYTGYFLLSAKKSPGNSTSTWTGRIGWRFYVWYSDDETCEGHKLVQPGFYWSYSYVIGPPVVHGGLTWQGGGGTSITSEFAQNRWVRYEFYFDSWPEATGSPNPTTTTIIVKSISPDEPEQSFVNNNMCQGGGTCMYSPGFSDSFANVIHMGRDTRSANGTCTNKYMYVLVGKNLGAGERIPVASEIESGGPIPSPPSAPSNLTVTFLYRIWHMLNGYWG